jgi:3-oxoacyl-[acyl-carrier protein] reductase
MLWRDALKALTRCLAAELGPYGIRVNMVSPGMVEIESLAVVPERLRKVQAMQTPLRRLAQPEDVGRVVVSLCSPAGEFITGADIPVCGGLQM